MGRLIRRYIRCYSLLAKDVVYGYKELAESLTTTIRGVRARAAVKTGITLTGSVYGVHVETELLGTGVISASFEGIRIEHYVEAGATLNDVYGICIANYIAKEPSGTYSMIRMGENAASTVDNLLQAVIGASCLDVSYCFNFTAGKAMSAWTTAGSCSGAAGYLKCLVNGNIRYIQLYSA